MLAALELGRRQAGRVVGQGAGPAPAGSPVVLATRPSVNVRPPSGSPHSCQVDPAGCGASTAGQAIVAASTQWARNSAGAGERRILDRDLQQVGGEVVGEHDAVAGGCRP